MCQACEQLNHLHEKHGNAEQNTKTAHAHNHQDHRDHSETDTCATCSSCGHDHEHEGADPSHLRRQLARIAFALLCFLAVLIWDGTGGIARVFGSENALLAEFFLYLIPFLIAGYDVLIRAARNVIRGHGLDENFLMSVACLGAFALVLFPDSEPHMAEGAAVMLFYQVGELFQSYAVGRSRKSIAGLMDIMPEFANVMQDGTLMRVAPDTVTPGMRIIVKPGERIPLDGIVLDGTSQVDTTALTGESIPREARPGEEVISGCVNLTGTLTVRTTKPYADSTVSRILELVQNAADKKARTENFITRFARYYTPIVVGLAATIALIPPLFAGAWSDWILRGLTFLVVSCPCALVISVPLSFFGGIGGASRIGVLIKGSNYLEALSKVDTIVFDKTGTLTTGTFEVTHVMPASGVTEQELLELAAAAESLSNHPIAQSISRAYNMPIEVTRVSEGKDLSGRGVHIRYDQDVILAGNGRLMDENGIPYSPADLVGTQVHVAKNGQFVGTIVIGDVVKPDAREAVEMLYAQGVQRTVMLTGDREDVAQSVAKDLGITEVRAELLPQDKVAQVEALLHTANNNAALDEPSPKENGVGNVAFVGDGINDAPVLMRADVGIAMGAMGSDAAIEAADIVLMDDRPTQIARAMSMARKTMRIVWQNIVFALGVKFAVLILAAFGIANMWMAVFADVGVAVLAILNAMRAMHVRS